MLHPVQPRLRLATAGAATLVGSVALAYVAQHPTPGAGLLDALAPVFAMAAYVGGTTAAAAGAFGLRLRGIAWTAATCVLALVLARCAIEPGVALAAVGRLPEGVYERWSALSNSLLWFAGVPLEVVFGAATCGAVLAVLALSGGGTELPAARPRARWGTQA